MTSLATMREVAGYMVRIYRSLKVRRVTLITIGVRKLIITIRMTILTLQRVMFSSKYKFRHIVIKRCRFPGIHSMAGCTVRREKTAHMVWVYNSTEIRLMTIDAIATKTGILIIFVTLIALDGTVRTN